MEFFMRCLVITAVLLLAAIAELAVAAVYSVGDSLAWNLNVNYTQWASKYAFALGDSVVFNFGGSHSVLMVEEVDYVLCNINSPLQSVQSGKPVTLVTRKNFFICGVPGHCITGMKVAIYATPRVNTPSSMEVASSAGSRSISVLWSLLLGLYLGIHWL